VKIVILLADYPAIDTSRETALIILEAGRPFSRKRRFNALLKRAGRALPNEQASRLVISMVEPTETLEHCCRAEHIAEEHGRENALTRHTEAPALAGPRR
jgi:hypothetical protein